MSQLPPHVPQELRIHRFPELDALRGLAAITVVIHHLLLLWVHHPWYSVLLATPLRIFCSGPQAVILFFVLSGFVLSGPQHAARRQSYMRYLVKRFTRIYLPFAAALLVAFLLDQHLYLRSLTSNQWVNETWTYRATSGELLQAAFTNMHYSQLFNTAFWSVFLEIQISIIFPLLYWIVSRVPAWSSIATACLLLFLPGMPANAPTLPLFLQTLSCFVVGILAFLHLDQLQRWIASRTSRTRIAVFLLALGIYTYGRPTVHVAAVPSSASFTNGAQPSSAENADTSRPGPLHFFVSQVRLSLSIFASMLLMIAIITQPVLRHVLTQSFLLRLGALSYSIYLMHGTVLFTMIRSPVQALPPVVFAIIFVALVYLVGEIFHLLVDAPSVRLARRVGRTTPARI